MKAITIDYPIETRAAWYVLAAFINPLDCHVKVADHCYAMNTSETLTQLFNKQPNERVELYYFSKRHLHKHLQGISTYYYRSRHNSYKRIGYGRTRNQAQSLPFSDLLHIRTKVKKSKFIIVMLIGIDLDCHHNEPDVLVVKDWIVNDVFPGAYWEPSTHGKGIHIYVKLEIEINYKGNLYSTLTHVQTVVDLFSHTLDSVRIQKGFHTPVDQLRGLPTLLKFEHQKIVIDKRPSTIKIPRFNQSAGVCNLCDVRRFHYAPSFGIRFFELINQELLKTLVIQPSVFEPEEEKPVPNPESDPFTADNRVLWRKIAQLEDTPGGGGGGVDRINAYYPTRFEDVVEKIKQETDALRRSNLFYMALSRQWGTVPDVQTAVQEYKKHGLHTGEDDTERTRRFIDIHEYVEATFDRNKCKKSERFSFSGFENDKHEILSKMEPLAAGTDLTYALSKSKRCRLKLNDLALTYWAMRRSQTANHSTSVAFSYQQLIRAFQANGHRGCNRNKAAKLFSVLGQWGLITKVNNPVPGYRGTVWKVN